MNSLMCKLNHFLTGLYRQSYHFSFPLFSSDGEKEEGDESLDLRRTESDSVLKKVCVCICGGYTFIIEQSILYTVIISVSLSILIN